MDTIGKYKDTIIGCLESARVYWKETLGPYLGESGEKAGEVALHVINSSMDFCGSGHYAIAHSSLSDIHEWAQNMQNVEPWHGKKFSPFVTNVGEAIRYIKKARDGLPATELA